MKETRLIHTPKTISSWSPCFEYRAFYDSDKGRRTIIHKYDSQKLYDICDVAMANRKNGEDVIIRDDRMNEYLIYCSTPT